MGITKFVLFTCFLLGSKVLFAQSERQALIIANGNYKHFSGLGTPIQEANELAVTLKTLGFEVHLVTNATREGMFDALEGFRKKIQSGKGIALFHYGGHGVQVNGKNYLIPADAEIPDERRVTTRAVDVDEIMLTLDSAGAETNILILDACRNNPLPAGASRSASRGLSVVGIKPRNSIIIYSAEAGTVAMDGLFTPLLTQSITKPGKSLTDILAEVRSQVYALTDGAQIPGEYNQLFAPIYLAGVQQSIPVWGETQVVAGNLEVYTRESGTLSFMGSSRSVHAGSLTQITGVSPGVQSLIFTDSKQRKETKQVTIESGKTVKVEFQGIAAPTPPLNQDSSDLQIGRVSYKRGAHTITLSSYRITTRPITQKQYSQLTGVNPSANRSSLKSGEFPIEQVSWLEAVAYCNLRSIQDGLSPVYKIQGKDVSIDYSQSGWRLPTEAEYQYAASQGLIQTPEGFKEWCGDWFGNYVEANLTDPTGIPTGLRRVLRNGYEPEVYSPTAPVVRIGMFPDLKDPKWTFRIVRREK